MSAAFLVLLCFFPFLVDCSSVVQGFREKYFEGFADRYLEDHIAQTHHVTTSIDCAFQCMSDSRCQSYNLQTEGTPTYKCDINSKNKTGEPLSLVNRPGFIYFQPVELHSRRVPVQAFTANFTNLGASGRMGPSSIGDHYRGQGHDGHVMLMSGIQHWRIPCTTRYTIEVVGASGGYDSLPARSFRGYGARMIGTFQLTKGETLKILVGQEGGTNTQSSSGGGGGSFVVRSDNTPLIIAGGGGGRETPQSLKTECHATASTSGNPGHSGCCTVGWSGGSNGNGANTADSGNSGGGGGGFLTSGRSSTSFGGSYGNGGEGGQGFLQGGVGGRALYNNAHGGFGGGGGAYGNGGGAGGGGGYSGGASGDNISDSCGGGGGSYNTGDQQNNSCCYNDKGHGFVYVTWAC